MPALRSILCALSRATLAGSLLTSATGCTPTPTLYVGVASSLDEAVTRWLADFDASHPEVRVIPISDSSRRLARQLHDGAPFDVFISARADLVQTLAREGLLVPPSALGDAHLALAVPVTARRDDVDVLLDRAEVVSVADLSVPLGDATARWARRHRPALLEDPRVRSLEGSARAVASRLDAGDSDAAVVYLHQCLSRTETWRCVPLNEPAGTVVIAVHAAAVHPELAAAIARELNGAALGLTPLDRARTEERAPT